jgi:hypothetical protein
VPSARGPWDVPALLEGVRLTDDPALSSEVAARLPPPSAPRPVSVSDLLALRRAYWRRLRGPAPLVLERELRLEQGRAWHHRLGDAVAAEGTLEVRFRRGGISGRIDLLAEVPVEVKTHAAAPDGAAPEEWPDQVEQLALYCALAGAGAGRIAHVAVAEPGPPSVSVAELEFRDLGRVRADAERREAALRAAVSRGQANDLPRCPWYDRGCEYRQAALCDCRGDEPAERSPVGEIVARRSLRPEIAERWTSALRSGPSVASPPVGHFRDLLYPRRTYFDRTRGRPPTAAASRPPTSPLDIYERSVAALELGPVGELHRLAAGPSAPGEEVLAWRGRPCLVRSSRVHARLTEDDVRARFPQYLVDLGFRCAATGRTEATLVLGYDVPRAGELPVQLFRVELTGGPGPFAATWRARRGALEAAESRRAPEELPACPAWMAVDCPYREACRCAALPDRSQR